MLTTVNVIARGRRASKHASWLAVILLTLALTACVTHSPRSADGAFPSELTATTLASGFEQIADRYIVPIPVSRLAIEGMRGLDTIDETVTVEHRDGQVSFSAANISARSFPAPDTERSEDWGRLATDVLLYARQSSDKFLQASSEDLIEAVFDGSLSVTDPYSRYAGAGAAQENRAKRSGFGGIGIRIKVLPEGARITELFEDSPAILAGLQVDDIVARVNGIGLAGKTRTEIRELVRGGIGTIADLVVLRNGSETHAYSVKREKVVAPTVKLVVEDNIIFVRITGFNVRTSQRLARRIIKARAELGRNAKGVILDLRGNPGGILDQAVKVADLFLVKGKSLSTRGRHPSSLHEYESSANDIAAGLPMAVLINGRSASAAEIVAAALQDNERAVVIGSASFGKGSVQSVGQLPNDGELTLTWSRFVTPSGYILHGLGVPPLVCTSPDTDNASALIARALADSDRLNQTLDAWHTVRPDDNRARDALRNVCLASNKRPQVDIEIADTLLSDKALYHRVLNLSPSMASAAKPGS